VYIQDSDITPLYEATDTLWEAHSDGSHLRRVLPGFGSGDGLYFGNWTPDGRYYVFQVTHGEGRTIWAMREAGDFWHKVSHQPVQLTHGEMDTELPLPSKDG